MLYYIKGTLAMRKESSLIIENGGTGYEISVPAGSELYSAAEGREVTVFTYMAVRDDDISLYGFDDEASLSLFKKLITVNGVGARAALAILSAVPYDEIRKAVIFGDADMLTRAPGIGKKTAQRIILDLKDKLGNIDVSGNKGHAAEADLSGDEKTEALNALVSLGYSRSEAATALIGISEEGLKAEDYIRTALKRI